MKRVQFVLVVAAIVGVILLIILHPNGPFFGKTDARVAALFDLVFGRRDALVVSKQVEPVKQVSASRTNVDVVISETAAPPAQWSSDQADIVDEAVRRQLELEGHHLDAHVTVARQPQSPSGAQKATSEIAEVGGAGEREDITPSQLALGTPLSGEISPVGDSSIGTVLSPTYVKVLPQQDGWDTAYDYASADRIVVRAGRVVVRSSELEAAARSLPDGYPRVGDARREFAERFLINKVVEAERTHDALNVGLPVALESYSLGAIMGLGAIADESGHAYTSSAAGSVAGTSDFVGGGKLAGPGDFHVSSSLADAELRGIYERERRSFDWLKVRQIFVAFGNNVDLKDGSRSRKEAAARDKAEMIRAQLMTGADFAEVARLESDDGHSAPNGGDLGRLVRGQMVQEFERAAFRLQPGAISPVVRTQYGFHIIRVEQRGSRAFGEVRDEVRAIRQQQLDWASAYVKKAGVSYDDSYFGAPSRRNVPAMVTPATVADTPPTKDPVAEGQWLSAPKAAAPPHLPAAKPPRP